MVCVALCRFMNGNFPKLPDTAGKKIINLRVFSSLETLTHWMNVYIHDIPILFPRISLYIGLLNSWRLDCDLVNILATLFYSPVYNRNGLTGWITATQPARPYVEFGSPGLSYPGGMGYPGGLGCAASAPQCPQLPTYPQLPSAPIQYPQPNYPQLPAAPMLYPQPSYPQPYRLGGYSEPDLQPYPQPACSPQFCYRNFDSHRLTGHLHYHQWAHYGSTYYPTSDRFPYAAYFPC